MDDLLSLIGGIFAFIIITVLILLPVVVLGHWTGNRTCNERFAAFEHKYGFWSGCLIKVNDNWVPDDSYYIKEDRK